MTIKKQPFDFYVVLDFEATCDDGKVPEPQEVIEFPSVLLSGETFEVVDQFESFVRPLHNPELTSFCTELTGITRQQTDQAPLFPEVFAKHSAWLRSHGLRVSPGDSGVDFTFVLCGDWDLKTMFPVQCKACTPPLTVIPYPYRQWINIKKHFAAYHGTGKAPGMPGMLKQLNLQLTGRHHSGIDDCRNIAKIVRRLAELGVELTTTTELPTSRYPQVTLSLSCGDETKELLLKRRALKSLLGEAGGLFRRQIKKVTQKDGQEVKDDRALTDLTDGVELILY